MIKFLLILLFLPTLLFGQLTQLDSNTFILKMNKEQMDKFFFKMIQYDVNDSLLQLEKSDNADLRKMLALKDSIIKTDSLIIEKKDVQLTSAQKWIDEEMSTKINIWQGVNIGGRIETKNNIEWKELNKSSFLYSLFADVTLRFGKFDFSPGINLYLDGNKPSYFLMIKYKLF